MRFSPRHLLRAPFPLNDSCLQYAAAWTALARLYADSGNRLMAEKAYEQARIANPEFAPTWEGEKGCEGRREAAEKDGRGRGGVWAGRHRWDEDLRRRKNEGSVVDDGGGGEGRGARQEVGGRLTGGSQEDGCAFPGEHASPFSSRPACTHTPSRDSPQPLLAAGMAAMAVQDASLGLLPTFGSSAAELLEYAAQLHGSAGVQAAYVISALSGQALQGGSAASARPGRVYCAARRAAEELPLDPLAASALGIASEDRGLPEAAAESHRSAVLLLKVRSPLPRPSTLVPSPSYCSLIPGPIERPGHPPPPPRPLSKRASLLPPPLARVSPARESPRACNQWLLREMPPSPPRAL